MSTNVDNVKLLIDPLVINSPIGPEILKAIRDDVKSFPFQVRDLKIPGSLRWLRKESSGNKIKGRRKKTQQEEEETWIEEKRVLIFLPMKDLTRLIEEEVFESWIISLSRENLDNYTLMIFGDHFRRKKNSDQRRINARIRSGNNESDDDRQDGISLYKVQTELCRLYSDHPGFDYLIDEGDNLCARTVFHYSRAVAETEDKLAKKHDQFGFWASGSKGNVEVTNSGVGSMNLWYSYLSQISGQIGIEKAKAIAGAYPSPTALMEALESSEDPEELLAPLKVRRGPDHLGGSVKVGSETGRKISVMFLSKDGEKYLNK